MTGIAEHLAIFLKEPSDPDRIRAFFGNMPVVREFRFFMYGKEIVHIQPYGHRTPSETR